MGWLNIRGVCILKSRGACTGKLHNGCCHSGSVIVRQQLGLRTFEYHPASVSIASVTCRSVSIRPSRDTDASSPSFHLAKKFLAVSGR
jgi:hypothetical protein